MQDLKIGYEMEGIRQVLCVMTLLAYNLIVCYVLSHQEGDLDFCDEVLNLQLMVIIENRNPNKQNKKISIYITI